MDYTLVVGVFKDGALYELKSSPIVVECTPADADKTPVSVTVTIPSDESDYSIRVYNIGTKTDWNVLLPQTVFN